MTKESFEKIKQGLLDAVDHENAIVKGPWTVGRDSGRIYIQDMDKTHDARLYLDGDWESDGQAMEYALKITKRLNRSTGT